MERKHPEVFDKTVRLNKFLATAGIGSRRKSDELIVSGVVKVNGKVVTELGTKIDPSRDRVAVQDHPIALPQKNVYILFNKPKDCITTVSDEKDRTTVMDYVRVKERIFPVGRLDRNTTGALLLTNDGELAHSLTHPSIGVEKIYRVGLDQALSDGDVSKMRKGIRLPDGPARTKKIEIIPGERRKKVLIAISEGRNRQVRRMFEALGYEVKQLERVAFAGMTTRGLRRGEWRKLQKKEIEFLKSSIIARRSQ